MTLLWFGSAIHVAMALAVAAVVLVVALKPLHDRARIKRVVVATYQSVSGAGKEAMDELINQAGADLWLSGHTHRFQRIDPIAGENHYTLVVGTTATEMAAGLHLPAEAEGIHESFRALRDWEARTRCRTRGPPRPASTTLQVRHRSHPPGRRRSTNSQSPTRTACNPSTPSLLWCIPNRQWMRATA